MRTIKFRAWDLYNKKMIELGDLENISIHKDFDFANYEVMQFTGLTDKNGVEIYEGDIVKTSHRGHQSTNIIYWEESKYESGNVPPYDDLNGFANFGTWKYKNIEDNELTIAMYENCCEVIGNIYETPNLLN